MNIATQVEGERIAKDVADHASALEVVLKRPKFFSMWNYWLSLLFGAAWGVFMVSYAGPYTQLILGAASGIALVLAIAVFKECLSLRRRLDAVITLLLQHER
ncbi:hypothetical protein [Roseateles oligotrophus]|uniref:Uncharacterized protein n=1 Tax=Roseateles oligotrophus TaxID=1769250 RepID=A0ABT2YIF1_9BURK|nr:hypothetical protein [Roseateles oligotrophus]MCV2369839.1 hypothetical protein [Roseateles oligotrophus]